MLLGVDVGGTFTDAVLVVAQHSPDTPATQASADPGAEGGATAIYTAKVPTTTDEQSRGVMEAVRTVLAHASAEPAQVERFAHGMTVATNALLEGRGARTALIATEGFADIVELGRQARAHLYRLCTAGPAPLAPAELRFEAPERMTPDGPLRALDPREAEELVERIARVGQVERAGRAGQAERAHDQARRAKPAGQADIEAVAVALLHSYAHPEHERLLGELLAARVPNVHVSLSHELVGTFREYERAATTEVDAALSPLVGAYLRRLGAQADARGLTRPAIMQSSGGLIDAEGAAAHAALTVLSGPAGGVRGALALAEAAGERNVVCLDMGGTSCDVCLIADGRVAETAEGVVAGRPLALAMLDIHTVGAGGGSIAWRDPGGALRVGPHSAGADPGPACYGRGGEHPTVTDANLLLGRLPADTPLAGGLRLDRDAAERAVAALAATLGLTTEVDPTWAGGIDSPAPGPPPHREAAATRRCAEGIVRVAEAAMTGALRAITVERGIDPRGFALMPFGGAGPLHAAALARELGMRRILVPRASGVLCALGLAAAAPRRDAARTVMLTGATLNAERLAAERVALVARACAELGEAATRVAVRYELRYHGQSFELAVDEEDVRAPGGRSPYPDVPREAFAHPDNGASPGPDVLREAFAQAHEQRYGYRDDGVEVELVTIRVSAWGAAPRLRLAAVEGEPAPGTAIEGPTVCSLPGSTLYVPDGWEGEVDDYGTVHLHDKRAGE
ncbi:MAG TPA: hydantoinase/oxoprolinase family protein [Solirubrobacteraceae bacterium]|jgi:N-methylhydantoinase A|nr:hydantoinase/oxoprolinase family protein [Solirubrobacteraceae bacterium]